MCASSAPVFPLAEIRVSFSYDDGGDDDYDGGVFFFGSLGFYLKHVSASASSAKMFSPSAETS